MNYSELDYLHCVQVTIYKFGHSLLLVTICAGIEHVGDTGMTPKSIYKLLSVARIILILCHICH